MGTDRVGPAAVLLAEAARFAVRLARLPAPEQADDLQIQRMVQRLVFLVAAGVAAGCAPPGAGARGVVVAIAGAMFLWEAWPEDDVSAADAAAAAPRTKRPRRERSRRR
jgi:hypothetical protein